MNTVEEIAKGNDTQRDRESGHHPLLMLACCEEPKKGLAFWLVPGSMIKQYKITKEEGEGLGFSILGGVLTGIAEISRLAVYGTLVYTSYELGKHLF